MRSRFDRFNWLLVTVLFAPVLTLPTLATAKGNPLCPGEDVFYNPGNGENIVVPPGFQVSVFAKDLNFPTAVAFRGDARRFEVFVLESGHGLPSRCNDETSSVVGASYRPPTPSRPTSWCSTRAGTGSVVLSPSPRRAAQVSSRTARRSTSRSRKASRAGDSSPRTQTRPFGQLERRTTASAS